MDLPFHRPTDSAARARARLLGDQAAGPVVEQRVRLSTLSDRLDRAGRDAMAAHLSSRVRTDRRFAPVLGTLMRMALGR